MIGSRGELSTKVRALLDRERTIPALPAVMRARMLVRARAALVARAASPPVREGAPRRTRWTAAVVLVCAASAAAATAAYQIGIRVKPVVPPAVVLPAPAPSPLSPRWAANPIADLPSAPVRARSLSKVDTSQTELRLIRQAREAVARDDFAAALPPLAEHDRRFKTGRLVEEREALRVKTLAALGRTDEARRAAAAFEARFPRSVLLHAVSQLAGSRP